MMMTTHCDNANLSLNFIALYGNTCTSYVWSISFESACMLIFFWLGTVHSTALLV